MSDFVKVATISEIPPRSMKSFEVNYTRVLVCNVRGHFYTVADECSHDSAPITDGKLENDQVVCPRHGARFSVVDGSVLGPPAIVPIDTFNTKIENDNIYIEVD
ncbi:MAG: non-heme iron oxygenase ferredoxin subunit [Candidatus Zixiibacteriota bacterium]|nr:MAG: non-heme iron oxygenase ferredoxin subunit [candidate division Zixibacteria bacterium]